MRVVSTIIAKDHNSIIRIFSIMKELHFHRFIPYLRDQKLAFHRENCPFDEELFLAVNCGISVLCFLEVGYVGSLKWLVQVH